jgi:hypothetical protein
MFGDFLKQVMLKIYSTIFEAQSRYSLDWNILSVASR